MDFRALDRTLGGEGGIASTNLAAVVKSARLQSGGKDEEEKSRCGQPGVVSYSGIISVGN
jgi:hypothetical protein